MSKIIVVNWMSLDGVMQGPGRPGEDMSGGFTRSGWADGFTDATVGRKLGQVMSGKYEFLFGRRSYDIMLQSWNDQGGPFKDALNSTPKYVASSVGDAELMWPNSTLLSGDVIAAVAKLKHDLDHDLVIMGSSVLIATLIDAGLIDEYVLMIAPLLLGEGRRLFPERHTLSRLTLRECLTANTGAIIAHYESEPSA